MTDYYVTWYNEMTNLINQRVMNNNESCFVRETNSVYSLVISNGYQDGYATSSFQASAHGWFGCWYKWYFVKKYGTDGITLNFATIAERDLAWYYQPWDSVGIGNGDICYVKETNKNYTCVFTGQTSGYESGYYVTRNNYRWDIKPSFGLELYDASGSRRFGPGDKLSCILYSTVALRGQGGSWDGSIVGLDMTVENNWTMPFGFITPIVMTATAYSKKKSHTAVWSQYDVPPLYNITKNIVTWTPTTDSTSDSIIVIWGR
jgi:hypothetical protein